MYFNVNSANRMQISGIGDISFYEDTGTTAKFFWDASAESLGIGNSTPSNNHANANNLVVGNGTAGGIANYVGTGLGWYAFSRDNANNSDAYDGGISYDGSRNLMFHTNAGTERMRIDSSGNVGIGTSSPTHPLVVSRSGAGIKAFFTNTTDADFGINLSSGITLLTPTTGTLAFGTSSTERMRIDSSGNVGIGTSSPAQALVVNRSSGNTYLEVSRATQSQGQVALQLTGGTGGTNWIMYQDTSSNDLKFFGNSADRMTIDSNGNVGIGTTSPTYKVDVSGTNPALRLKSSAAFGYIIDQNTSSGLVSHIVYENVDMRFGTNSTERMRINSSGYLLVGTTSTLGSNPARLEVYTVGSGGRIIQTKTDINGNTNHLTFNTPSGQAGQIYTNTLTTTYGTSSDYRLKENVVDLSDATTRLKQLAPKRFNFIADVDAKTVDGFLAHEVQSIVPEAIYGIKDEVDADGNPVYQGIDQSKLVPLLTAALKEAITKIETLETEMTSVKARLDALEAN